MVLVSIICHVRALNVWPEHWSEVQWQCWEILKCSTSSVSRPSAPSSFCYPPRAHPVCSFLDLPMFLTYLWWILISLLSRLWPSSRIMLSLHSKDRTNESMSVRRQVTPAFLWRVDKEVWQYEHVSKLYRWILSTKYMYIVVWKPQWSLQQYTKNCSAFVFVSKCTYTWHMKYP